MPTLIDDLLADDVFDAGRQLAADLGLRPFRVTVRTVDWSGGEVDEGTATTTDVELLPRPKQISNSARLQATHGGTFEAGDVGWEKISLDYTREQLEGQPRSKARQVFWLVDDGDTVETYTLVELRRKTSHWQALTRRTRRPRG